MGRGDRGCCLFVQDCKILPVFPPIFPSQALWPLSQENASLMDLNEHLAFLCGHHEVCKVPTSPQLSLGAASVTLEPAWVRVVLMHYFFLPSWDHHILPQGLPQGSDSWASAGMTWTLNVSLVLVAARRMAKSRAKGCPGLLASSHQGMFCFPSLGSIISVEIISLLPL